MHFYTYDDWLNNAYYSKDNKEISKNSVKVVDITSDVSSNKYLTIRSCWRNPTFVSTYSRNPAIVPTMSTIDCDVGCLYQMKSSSTYPDSTKAGYRMNRGCIQELRNHYRFPNPDPVPLGFRPDIELVSRDQRTPIVYYDNYTGLYKKVISINLSEYTKFERILVFQSVYSGAISFQEMNSSLEFFMSSNSPTSSDYDYKNYDFKINTNLYNSSSLMIVGAVITFDIMGSATYMWIQNISKFVYGHVDMDRMYDWGNIWTCFTPPTDAPILESSIMHFAKR